MHKLTTLALSGLSVAALIAATAWFWLDRSLASPLHHARECRAAAQIAKITLGGVEANNRRLAKDGLHGFTVKFNPMLRAGVSAEGRRAAFVVVLPEKLERYLLPEADVASGARLDCTTVFREQHLPTLRHPKIRLEMSQNIMLVNFARIVFSLDGHTAYVVRESVCGPLCGAGFETRWRKKGDSWVLEASEGTWIS